VTARSGNLSGPVVLSVVQHTVGNGLPRQEVQNPNWYSWEEIMIRNDLTTSPDGTGRGV
jgi:hypothetical protein